VAEPGPDVLLASAEAVFDSRQGRLVDLVDTLLDAGVCLRGELWLSVADVDLVFVGLDVILCSHDRVLPRQGKM
jgi:hypothetical protein